MADLNEEEHKVDIISLPNDMLIEVLTKVASSSFNDLFKAKISCSDLCRLADDDQIFQQLSLKKISLFWPKNSEVTFLRCYKESGN
jgi:hypothetical protein